jgi:hypothetical protein
VLQNNAAAQVSGMKPPGEVEVISGCARIAELALIARPNGATRIIPRPRFGQFSVFALPTALLRSSPPKYAAAQMTKDRHALAELPPPLA